MSDHNEHKIDVDPEELETFTLEDILAEFGHGAAVEQEAEDIPVDVETAQPDTTQQEAPLQSPEEPEPAAACHPAEEEVTAPEEPVEAPREQLRAPSRLGAKILHFPSRFKGKGIQEQEEEPAEEAEPAAPQEPESQEPEQPQPESQSPGEEEQPQPEPQPPQQDISLEDLMASTVESVLDGDDAILDEPEPLGQRLIAWVSGAAAVLRCLARHRRKAVRPKHTQEEAAPEPDMDEAARQATGRCKKLRRQMLWSALPTVALAAVSVLDMLRPAFLPDIWLQEPLLRYGVTGGLLALTAALALSVWQGVYTSLRGKRPDSRLAAALTVLAVLADCVYGAVTADAPQLPFAAPAALLVWTCLAGEYCLWRARREAYRLAQLGGRPPYGVTITAAGACKQRGKLRGFYNISRLADPAERLQVLLVPMLLSAATVLAGVVCLGGSRTAEFFHVWSAMLLAAVPLGLPLSASLPLSRLNRRLSRSGSAVAGYAGAAEISESRRLVVTDADLFPPGTVSLNGLKIYGEEIGKVASYAATVARASESPLRPIFDHLLASEGGTCRELEDLCFYEEGGVGGTIRGESVLMGSAFFMKKMHVSLPRELKVKTGVFLAVDRQLIAIFAIKYQTSRNVEWALRALRRSRTEVVLAVRGSNVTPGLLKAKFHLKGKPVYPDISTRLALSDLSGARAERANAILYRDGLMPLAETVIGSRRCCRMVKAAVAICVLGAVCGLLLGYYLTGQAVYSALNAGYLTGYSLLWLLPVLLLGDLVKHY